MFHQTFLCVSEYGVSYEGLSFLAIVFPYIFPEKHSFLFYLVNKWVLPG